MEDPHENCVCNKQLDNNYKDHRPQPNSGPKPLDVRSVHFETALM